MSQKSLNLILIICAAVFAVLAIALLVVGILHDPDNTFTKIVLIVASVISFAVVGELVYMLSITNSVTPNYFLYDSKAKRNVSVNALNVNVVNARMANYFSNYATSEGKLWTEGVLASPTLDMPDEFKPVVAYKLLLDLATFDKENGWKCFEVASVETVDFICTSLEMNGENEIATNLRMMKAVQPFQIKYVRDYLISNKAYLQAKMMRYVRENIKKFQ